MLNQKTGEYEPIRLEGKYTLASHSYLLMEYGGGATMFKDAKLLADTNTVTVDGDTFETDRTTYIKDGRTYISADCLMFCD